MTVLQKECNSRCGQVDFILSNVSRRTYLSFMANVQHTNPCQLVINYDSYNFTQRRHAKTEK